MTETDPAPSDAPEDPTELQEAWRHTQAARDILARLRDEQLSPDETSALIALASDHAAQALAYIESLDKKTASNF